jgi:trans-2,3-dihydro-3-hydroxyanthranilate isomerase
MQHDREAVARATGLRVQDFDDSLPIRNRFDRSSVHRDAAEIARGHRESADRSRPRRRISRKTAGKFFYFVTRETVDREARLHARMLFYNGEDPATGSAAGCAAAWMVAHGVAKPDERVLIEQGVEMKRPSRIFVRASRIDNRVVNVRVGGQLG